MALFTPPLRLIMMPTLPHASSVLAHRPLLPWTIMTIITLVAAATPTSMWTAMTPSIGIIILASTSVGVIALIGEPIGAGIHIGAIHGTPIPTGVIHGILTPTIGAILTGPMVGDITTTTGITHTTIGMAMAGIILVAPEATMA